MTCVASGCTPARANRSRTRTPVHVVSNLLHFVTQWMSNVGVTDGIATSSSNPIVNGVATSPWIVRSHCPGS